MIDSVIKLLPEARRRAANSGMPKRFVLVTLHRPSNVDDPQMLRQLMTTLIELSAQDAVVFPVHPRTRRRIEELGISVPSSVLLLDPLGYLDFLALQTIATLIVTDSGGIQEESTYLGAPCLTVRNNTERPVTVTVGTNTLVGQDMNQLLIEARRVLDGGAKQGAIPALWDGKASDRIARTVVERLATVAA
jgi:UDP-N-acetylglucosamine 2-epimerase (non-hydrolysing)